MAHGVGSLTLLATECSCDASKADLSKGWSWAVGGGSPHQFILSVLMKEYNNTWSMDLEDLLSY